MLSNRQIALQLQGEQLLSSVLLIKALGGGWNDSFIPSPEKAAGETKWTDYLILPLE
jgi:outer membrane protein TolC